MTCTKWLRSTVLAGIVVALGCATPYQPMGFSGGYKEELLYQDVYFVEFHGNANTARSTVTKYVYQRANELCREKGFDDFVVLDEGQSAGWSQYGELPRAFLKIKCVKQAETKRLSQKDSDLIEAATLGSLQKVERLLGEGANINTRTEAGLTPLHVATIAGKKDIVDYLIKMGADLETRDDEDCTPLYYAAIMGNRDVAEYLIIKGANINARTKNQFTPLLIAVMKKNKAVAILLVEKGADVNARCVTGLSPLSAAEALHMADLALLLRERGAEP